MDIKWNKKIYADHYHHKSWRVYVDIRENRILIIRWDGERLNPIEY